MGKYLSDNLEDPQNLTFMGDVDAALHRRGHPWAFTLSLAVVGFFFVAYIWADFTMIDDIIRGNGKIIPAEGIRDIQSDKGGAISSIKVVEGQDVEANEVVAIIDNVQDVSALQDLKNRSKELELSLIRLQAEAEDTPLVFSEEMSRSFPVIVQSQMQIYEANRQRFENEDRQLLEQIEQRKKEVEIARETKDSTEKALAILQEEDSQKKPLVGRSVPVIAYLELQERLVTREGELASIIQTIARAESAESAAVQRLQNRASERQKAIALERNKNRVEMNEINQRISSWTEQVSRAELRSPVRGTIKNIIMKEGSVARNAEVIMQILPKGDVLEIEAKFSPADRGFLYIGQKGMAKFTTYEFSIYGGLEATVTRISDDTVLDKRGEPWYEVRLVTQRKSIQYQGKEFPILPGMTLSVDLLADKRSILQHVLGPIIRAQQSAMTEH